ncbi:MAG: hypothetical protein ACOX7H_06555 [Bacillota bacterium]|jgi:hypothetical protein
MCDVCAYHDHQISITLPIAHIDNPEKAHELQETLNGLHGIDNVIAYINERQVSFTLTEHGDMQQVTDSIKKLGLQA